MIVLLSGGIDSLVCAELYHKMGQLTGCVFVDYRHPASAQESAKASRFCNARGVPLRRFTFYGLHLADMQDGTGAQVVPHRNALLLSAAANAASEMGGHTLVIGAAKADQADYADCHRPFFDMMAGALGMDILTPLINDDKPAIIKRGRALGLTKSDTWSCYGNGPMACGACASCAEAEKAWG